MHMQEPAGKREGGGISILAVQRRNTSTSFIPPIINEYSFFLAPGSYEYVDVLRYLLERRADMEAQDAGECNPRN